MKKVKKGDKVVFKMIHPANNFHDGHNGEKAIVEGTRVVQMVTIRFESDGYATAVLAEECSPVE